LRSKSIELGEGYSISVNYDEDGLPKIQVKTYGKIDISELIKEIRRKYPRATIYGSECQPTIEVSAKPKLKRRKERLKRRKNERKKRRKV